MRVKGNKRGRGVGFISDGRGKSSTERGEVGFGNIQSEFFIIFASYESKTDGFV